MSDPAEFEFDVFISYSSKDKEWVRGVLLHGIEQAGLKAYIDFRDFRPGAPSIKECERGVARSRKTLLILTRNYLDSAWGEIENVMAQTLDLGSESLRLIPLLKEDCPRPIRIGALTYVDFTEDADKDSAWRTLLTALGKPPEPDPPIEMRRDQWFLAHPYPMPPNFTGRRAEREMLDRWLAEDPTHALLSLLALGGFGKSALVWHWLMHDVGSDAWPRVVWWSFYERDANFDNFLCETIHYLSDGATEAADLVGRHAVDELVRCLGAPGSLLVLDGFERVLRAFGGLDAAYQGDEGKHEDNDRDCISTLAELFLLKVSVQPQLRSKVILTTRLRPRVLEAKGGGLLVGVREEPIGKMDSVDAVAFFRAQGVRGTRTEIEASCEPYGYHPLSLRLVAGLIVDDFQQPGDIAAARNLDVSGDLIQRQHHVLEAAYDCLTQPQRALLGRIACFRSPVAYKTLAALAKTEVDTNRRDREQKTAQDLPPAMPVVRQLDPDLRSLERRGLVYHDTREQRFDLHPIVRRYAYDRLSAPDRASVHIRLRDYFAAVPQPDKVTSLDDLVSVIERYHHTVRAGQLDEACLLYRDRLANPLYYQLGASQLIIDLLEALLPDGEGCPPRLKDERAQGWTLNALANSYSHSGQPRRAVPAFEQANAIGERLGDKGNLAVGLGNLADMAYLPIGALRAAEANLRRSIKLSREVKNTLDEAAAQMELGRVLAYRGAYRESDTILKTALKKFRGSKNLQSQSVVWNYRALCELLRLRHVSIGKQRGSRVPDTTHVLASARRALELAEEEARIDFPVEMDYLRAHWILGAAQRVAGRAEEAEHHLHEALDRCRRIANVEHEADILVELARIRAATGAIDEAQRLTEEALFITERSGYVLQCADANIELARLMVASGHGSAAYEHVAEARRLATCDGPPGYAYAAAYAESSFLLEQL